MSAWRQVDILNWSRPLTLNLLGRSRVDLCAVKCLASVQEWTKIDAAARVSSPGLNVWPMDTVIIHCTLSRLFISCLLASSVPRTKVNQKFSDPHPKPTPPPTPPPLEVWDLTIGGPLSQADKKHSLSVVVILLLEAIDPTSQYGRDRLT